MSKSNTYENDVLLLELNNTNIANVGDATGVRGSSTAGSLYLSLHTADPGEAGNQGTSECAYTGYARVAVARSSGGFTVSGSSATLAANADFPVSDSSANEVATHFGLGTSSSGAGKLMRSGIIGGPYKPFVAADAATDLITEPGHGLVAGDRVVFEAIEGVALPTGITQGTRYFVIATGLTTDAYKVSATSGGSSIDITAVGGGLAAKSVAINIVGANVTPRLGTGTTITEG
jgi:hypothetical protein